MIKRHMYYTIVSPLIIMLFWGAFVYNKNNIKPLVSSSEISKSDLYDFTAKTTFQKADLDKFKVQLGELEKKSKKTIEDYREEAKMNDYLGYPGRGVLIYETYLSGALDFVHYNNLGYLYKEICFAKLDKTCDKALTNFYLCLNNYGSKQAYTDIIEILVKKGDKAQAKKEYDNYKKKLGKKDDYLENLVK